MSRRALPFAATPVSSATEHHLGPQCVVEQQRVQRPWQPGPLMRDRQAGLVGPQRGLQLGLLTEHRADGHPDQVRARTILAEGSIHSGDLARASAALDEAEAMLARGGITRTDLGFEVAAQRALLAGVRNDLAGLDAAAEKALALAGSPRDRLRVHGYVSSTYTNAGQYDRAIAAAKAGLAAVATDNTPELVLRRHETLLQLGLACLGGGRLDEADAAFVEAIERISTEPNTGALTLLEARIGLGSVLTQRGKWAEARSELEHANKPRWRSGTSPGSPAPSQRSWRSSRS